MFGQLDRSLGDEPEWFPGRGCRPRQSPFGLTFIYSFCLIMEHLAKKIMMLHPDHLSNSQGESAGDITP